MARDYRETRSRTKGKSGAWTKKRLRIKRAQAAAAETDRRVARRNPSLPFGALPPQKQGL